MQCSRELGSAANADAVADLRVNADISAGRAEDTDEVLGHSIAQHELASLGVAQWVSDPSIDVSRAGEAQAIIWRLLVLL